MQKIEIEKTIEILEQIKKNLVEIENFEIALPMPQGTSAEITLKRNEKFSYLLGFTEGALGALYDMQK